jgi:hypothetical protein
MAIHVITVVPARKANLEPLPGKFDAFIGERQLVCQKPHAIL